MRSHPAARPRRCEKGRFPACEKGRIPDSQGRLEKGRIGAGE